MLWFSFLLFCLVGFPQLRPHLLQVSITSLFIFYNFFFLFLKCPASNLSFASFLLVHLHVSAEIISGVVSNVVSALVKWLWSLKSTTKTGIDLSLIFPVLPRFLELFIWKLGCFLKWVQFSAVPAGRSMMKFEGGYTVETVFDGSKLGIEPYSVEVSPSGELMVLDSENSNIYKISTPLSRCKLSFANSL